MLARMLHEAEVWHITLGAFGRRGVVGTKALIDAYNDEAPHILYGKTREERDIVEFAVGLRRRGWIVYGTTQISQNGVYRWMLAFQRPKASKA